MEMLFWTVHLYGCFIIKCTIFLIWNYYNVVPPLYSTWINEGSGLEAPWEQSCTLGPFQCPHPMRRASSTGLWQLDPGSQNKRKNTRERIQRRSFQDTRKILFLYPQCQREQNENANDSDRIRYFITNCHTLNSLHIFYQSKLRYTIPH